MLNNEKITPYFLNLVKETKNEDPISSITNDDETPFESDDERNNFIKILLKNYTLFPRMNYLLKMDALKIFWDRLMNTQ